MNKELKKVSWISNKEAVGKSAKTVAICLICAALLYVIDLATLGLLKVAVM